MRNAIAIFAGAAALATAWPAAAEHQGPRAVAVGSSPEQAIDKLEKACVERGFAAKRMAPNDLVCQGGEFKKSPPGFRPGSPAMDPFDGPQIYHRFVADPGDGGAIIRERSQAVMGLPGSAKPIVIDLIGVAAMKIRGRILELYESLGFVVQPSK